MIYFDTAQRHHWANIAIMSNTILSNYYKKAVYCKFSTHQTILLKLQFNLISILDMVEEYSASSKITDPLEEDGTCHSRALKQCC
jgi:hypothetical protein